MTDVIKSDEYRKLELDSSNLLMQWDSLWVLGEYEKATLAAREAGEKRFLMGQMCADAGDFTPAAEDWSSSVQALLQGGAVERADLAFSHLQDLFDRNLIPPERADLQEAYRVCRANRDSLARKRGTLLQPSSSP